ncbi:sugar efflux transporter [Actinoplanes sp. NPDC051475]|uniref:sugar efflux transporter n=1 Tax=Actinoplanes sp. NPDC051475 TaxID=3157225 RepID=UPI00344B6FC5
MTVGEPAATTNDVAERGRFRPARDGALASLVGSTLMIDTAGAMVVTSMSLFLTDAVRATPLMVGLFFAGRAISEIATDLVVGVFSDRIASRRRLLAVCALFSAAGAASFLLIRDYYVLFACAAVCFGIGGATFSQLFAYTREFAEFRGADVSFFNSAIRAVTSAAWIIGPPLGLFLVGQGGFKPLYATAAILYAVPAVLCLAGLPDVRKQRPEVTGKRKRPFAGLTRQSGLLLAAIVVMLTINMMYQIDIALFVTKELGFGAGFAGILLGLASALEIPIMLLVGSRSTRFGKWRLVVVASLAAALFFALLPLATSAWQLLALQVLNAGFTAIVLSIPVVILQDAMPDRPGAASALYSGAFKAGAFLGGAIVGTATTALGFANIFWVSAGLALLATSLLILGRRP